MAAVHCVKLLAVGGSLLPCITNTAPMVTSVLRECGATASSSQLRPLEGPLAASCSSVCVSASSSTDEVRAAPRYGHVLTTTLSRKGVPIMMVRQRASFRLGTRAVLREQVHLVCVSTAKCPLVGQISAMRVRMIVGGIPATCRQPSSLSHVLIGSLAHAVGSSWESVAYVSHRHVCVVTWSPAAQLAQIK